MPESAALPLGAVSAPPVADAGAADPLLEAADAMTPEELDALPYGMIQLAANTADSRKASFASRSTRLSSSTLPSNNNHAT